MREWIIPNLTSTLSDSYYILALIVHYITMRQILVLILTVLPFTQIPAQTDTTVEQNFELTKKNIKRVFSIKPGFCCPEQKPIWTACYDSDSTYFNADTIRLYSDQYYYLGAHCCYITSWDFHNTSTFSLSKTHVCEEPPPSRMSADDYRLKIKFSKKGDFLTMSIRKKGKIKDIFDLVALESNITYGGKPGYKLTMVRRKRDK